MCSIPEQIYKVSFFHLLTRLLYSYSVLNQPRLQPEHIRKVLELIPRNPEERLARIMGGRNLLAHQSSTFLVGAHVDIATAPLIINGRFLSPPNILVGSLAPQQPPQTISLQRPGTWDMMGKRLYRTRTVQWTCVVMNLTGHRQSRSMADFLFDLVKLMGEKGKHLFIFYCLCAHHCFMQGSVSCLPFTVAFES